MMATAKKKVLSVILALVLCLGLLPVSVFAENVNNDSYVDVDYWDVSLAELELTVNVVDSDGNELSTFVIPDMIRTASTMTITLKEEQRPYYKIQGVKIADGSISDWSQDFTQDYKVTFTVQSLGLDGKDTMTVILEEKPVSTEETCTVTFHWNIGDEDVYAGSKVETGESFSTSGVDMPEAPTYYNGNFVKWSTKAEKELFNDDDYDFTADTIVISDMDVYARWEVSANASEFHVIDLEDQILPYVQNKLNDTSITIENFARMDVEDSEGNSTANYLGELMNGKRTDPISGISYWHIQNRTALLGAVRPEKLSALIVTLENGTTVTIPADSLSQERVEGSDPASTPKVVIELRLKDDQGGQEPEPGTYTVTFDSMGGTAVAPITEIASGSTITKPADPTKDNSTFVGWYKEEECTTPWSFSEDTVTDNIILYAKWTPKDDGSNVSSIARFYIKGLNTESYTVSGPLPGLTRSLTVKAGYVYLESQEIAGVESGKTDITLSELANTKLTGSFDSVEELVAAANTRLSDGNKLTVTDYTGFTYDNVKWEGSDNAYHIHIKLTEKTQHTVTYQYTGTVPTDAPALPEVTSYSKGQTVPVAAAPTLSGYTFSGWTSSDVTISNGSFSNGSFAMPEKAVTLTGSWTKNSSGGSTSSTTYYTVIVNYYNQATGDKIANSYSERIREGSSYDVTAYDAITIDGYTYVETTGDALTGTMNSSKVINVYYTAETDLGEDDVPMGELPDGTGDTGNTGDSDVNLGDGDVPMAEVPETGDALMAWIAAAAVSGVGLVWLSITSKKRKDEEF